MAVTKDILQRIDISQLAAWAAKNGPLGIKKKLAASSHFGHQMAYANHRTDTTVILRTSSQLKLILLSAAK